MTITIDLEKCKWTPEGCNCDCDCNGGKQCECCAESCPEGAIIRDDVVKVDESKCTDCGLCIDTCPSHAISMN